MIWLFPTKGYVSNLINEKLGTSSNQVFNNNIESMKTAAISYYNNSEKKEKEDEIKKSSNLRMLKCLISVLESGLRILGITSIDSL